MKKRVVVTIILIAIAVTLLAGCAKKEVTLESFVDAKPSEKVALEEAIKKEDYNARIEFEVNTMRIIYTVEDSAVTKEILDSAMEMMVDTFSNIAKDISKSLSIEGVQVEIVYEDADGKIIASRVFE